MNSLIDTGPEVLKRKGRQCAEGPPACVPWWLRFLGGLLLLNADDRLGMDGQVQRLQQAIVLLLGQRYHVRLDGGTRCLGALVRFLLTCFPGGD